MRRRLSYANVAATLALVFSMSGGALAASHYLINATKQINPKVLKKLKGATGHTGKEGPPGPSGKEGAVGPGGAPGPSAGFSAFKESLGTLAAEQTLGSLTVPAGSYVVSAKVWLWNTGSERAAIRCVLLNTVNSASDETYVTPDAIESTPYNGRDVVVLEAAATLASAGRWQVICKGNGTVKGENLEIDAIQVATLSRSEA
jgi:hypothetical protein